MFDIAHPGFETDSSPAGSGFPVLPKPFLPPLKPQGRCGLVFRFHQRMGIVAGLVLFATTSAALAQVTLTNPTPTASVGFGHVQMGATSPVARTLHFTLDGSAGLGSVQALTLGIPNADFTVAGKTSRASGNGETTCEISIGFSPKAPGLRRGALVIYDAANPPNTLLSIPLYGFADAPLPALTPHPAVALNTGGAGLAPSSQIAVDGLGNLYVAGGRGETVLKLPAGDGIGTPVGVFGAGLSGADGLALDGAGNLFVADQNRIVVITPAGAATALSIGGLSTPLSAPSALTFDAEGNLYIADAQNGRVVKVASLDVTATTASGIGSVVGTGAFSLGNAAGVAVAPSGTIYIADAVNNRVVQVSAAGAASTLIPSGLVFNDPQGVGVDGMGNIYVADSGNNRIVEITNAGVTSVVSTVGLPDPSALNNPTAVTADAAGNIYISDANNRRIVEVPVGGASLLFPRVRVGVRSSTLTATVTNLGSQPLIFATDPASTPDFPLDSSEANSCTSSTALAPGTTCDVSVAFTPHSAVRLSAGITLTNNALNVDGSTQMVAASGLASDPADSTTTTVSAVPSSLTAGQAISVAATVSDTTSGHAATIPTGQVAFTDSVGSTLTSLNNGVGINLSASGTATLSGIVLRGVGTHTLTGVYEGTSNSFLPSTGSTTVAITQGSVVLTLQPGLLIFGQASSVAATVSGPAANFPSPSGTISYTIVNSSGAVSASGTITLTVGSINSTASIPVASTLAPGGYTVGVTYSGDGNYLPVATAVLVPLMVHKASPTISLVSSLNPVLVTNPVTFTATVSSTVGSPTGSINFLDGQTLLSNVPLAQGMATYSTSSLSAGTHPITATYSGDSNFASVASSVLTQTVGDFTMSVSNPLGEATTPEVLPGAQLSYVLQMGPTRGINFPSTVTFSTSGLPPGATTNFTPSSLGAGSPAASVTLAIHFAQQIVKRRPPWPLGGGTAFAMIGGFVLLPFRRKLFGSRPKAGGLASLLLLALTVSAALGLDGCGGSRTGYFGQQPKSFTVTITASSGALSHSQTVTFILE